MGFQANRPTRYVYVFLVAAVTLTGCGLSDLSKLGATGSIFDMSKPAVMGDTMSVNAHMQAYVSDSIEVNEKLRLLTHGLEGGLSENGVFSVERLSCSPDESEKIANKLGLIEVKNRNDPDSLNCSRLSELVAAKWRSAAASVQFYKSMNKPEALKLKSGRRFDHAFYFYDEDTKHGRLELSYGTVPEVRAAEMALEEYMTPKKPPAETLARATAGDAQAQYELGKFFQGNNSLNRSIPYSSISWYKKAAQQNHSEAQYELGSIFLSRLVPGEPEEGVKWLTASAQAGNPSAKTMLGAYQTNSNSSAERAAGRELLAESARAGNSRAIYSLALVTEDNNQAINLLKKVVAKDPAMGKSALPSLVQKLRRAGRSEEAMHSPHRRKRW
ncbi:MAG: sel1 repeat family protein [Candidatus Obscuribacterales bacterium]|nr:sel1 repeat family protein [Candidatus Obscuribacterales bacterium]